MRTIHGLPNQAYRTLAMGAGGTKLHSWSLEVKKQHLIGLAGFLCLVTLMAAAQSEFPQVELSADYSYVNINPKMISSPERQRGQRWICLQLQSRVRS